VLNDIAGFYATPDEAIFSAKCKALADKFALLERHLGTGPYFDGTKFSLVDAVLGPIFRYFNVFDRIGEFGILLGKPRVAEWREALAVRQSVHDAVADDYNLRLWVFLKSRNSYLSSILTDGHSALIHNEPNNKLIRK
jgi:glutathione S-transferase